MSDRDEIDHLMAKAAGQLRRHVNGGSAIDVLPSEIAQAADIRRALAEAGYVIAHRSDLAKGTEDLMPVFKASER